MNYDVDYFIKKFEDIPEDEWCTEDYMDGDKRCALGHCMTKPLQWNTEMERLCLIIVGVAAINDGKDPRYQQPTPKQRILAALYDIKNQGEKFERSVATEVQPESLKPETKTIIKYVSVPQTINESLPETILS